MWEAIKPLRTVFNWIRLNRDEKQVVKWNKRRRREFYLRNETPLNANTFKTNEKRKET